MVLVSMFLAAAATSPCSIVKPSYGSQYVTYERRDHARPDYGYESDERVWFRFHNNTTCALTIPAAMPFVVRTLPDGGLTADPVDGVEVALDVSITGPERGEMWLHPPGCMRSESTLPGGQSVVFGVAANLLKRGPVAIDFAYAWEKPGSPYRGTVQHRLLFDVRQDFPYVTDFKEWLDKVKDPPKRPALSREFPGRHLSGEPADPSPKPSVEEPGPTH